MAVSVGRAGTSARVSRDISQVRVNCCGGRRSYLPWPGHCCGVAWRLWCAFGMGIDERPELAQLPEALPSLHARGKAIAGARPDERFSGVTRQPGGTQPREEIPERGEGALVELAGSSSSVRRSQRMALARSSPTWRI